ncbi:MAG: hypothetical protein U1E38_02550 [Rhodospirillales bacterium]
MNKEETLALWQQGKDAWNAWAQQMLAHRAEMEQDGTWAARQGHFVGEDVPENKATAVWMRAAVADFAGQVFDDSADFSGFLFAGSALFYGARFKKYASFNGATFKRKRVVPWRGVPSAATCHSLARRLAETRGSGTNSLSARSEKTV